MLPDSLYLWMYRQGLARYTWDEVALCLMRHRREARDKDWVNYWNGWFQQELYGRTNRMADAMGHMGSRLMAYSMYPVSPYEDSPEVENRWVPCNSENRPMVKWGKGCMTKADAMAMSGQVFLAENLLGTKMLVIDVDGDHNNQVDQETLDFFGPMRDITHCLSRPGPEPCLSYHLTFATDRVIPTMHFPMAHVDVIGNMRNSLRYRKDKTYNGMPMRMMDEALWDSIKNYLERRQA